MVRENGSDTYHYVYSDHLGSILTLTDAGGTIEAEQNFDAWGRRRNASSWAYTGVVSPPDWLYRGYTGHEHLDPFVLINMNGRIYDPVVGRVLSPDNYVQDPFSTQGFNRYSYGFNNPLRYTDPDGNFAFVPFLIAAGIGAISGYLSGRAQGAEGWGLVGYTFGGAVLGGLSYGIGDAVLGAFPLAAQSSMFASSIGVYAASGAAAGFVSGGGFAVLNGGNFWEGAFKGAAIGGLTGALAGVLRYDSFVNSLSDPANLVAENGPIAYTKNLQEVTVRGIRQAPQIRQGQVAIPIPRPIPIPIPFVGHGNNTNNPRDHYVYQIISYNPNSFMDFNLRESYTVEKYGISQDKGYRVRHQVDNLNKNNTDPNILYDYRILHSHIPNRTQALLLEKFHVTMYYLRTGTVPIRNLRPLPWR